MDLSAGTVVAEQYQLESVLGSGGTGVVWKARDLTLNRFVALKVLRADVDSDPSISIRFQREARILASLDHPAIVPIFAWLTLTDAGGRQRPCIVMQLTSSAPLSHWIRERGLLPLDEAIVILRSLLGALAVAHEAGIFHRDVKPQNILIDHVNGQTRARLVDFGIAKTSVPDATTTQTGMVLGTPAYMSPEQIQDSSKIDERADLWALAVCFFELLTGELPFAGASLMEILTRILTGPAPSAREHLATLPLHVDDFFARAFARSVADRPASAAELLALLPALTSDPPTLISMAPPHAPFEGDFPVSARGPRSEPLPLFVGRDAELHRLSTILQRMVLGAGSLAFMVGTAGAGKSALVEIRRFPANDFAAELAVAIERRTGGHPLFVEALVRMLIDRSEVKRCGAPPFVPHLSTLPSSSGVRDALPPDVVRWRLTRPVVALELDVPDDVKSLIRRKMESLDDESRRTLQYASVDSDEFLSVILAVKLGVDEIALEERLDGLARTHRIIVCCGEDALPDGTISGRYRFVQALYAAVLYDDLVPKRRAQLHHLVAERLTLHHGAEAERIAARLAVHWEKGRDLERAIECYTLAGRNAVARFAYAEAADHQESALRLLDKLPPEGVRERRLSLLAELGEVHLNLARFDAAIADFERMAAAARAPAQESAALNGLCRARFFAQRTEGLGELVAQALAAADRAEDRALRAGARTIAALHYLGLGQLERAVELLEEALDLAGRASGRMALGLRGLIHYYQSEYEPACQILEEVEQLAEAADDGHTILLARFGRGLSLANLGRMSEALAALEGALSLAERNSSPCWTTRLPDAIGWLYGELGADVTARGLGERPTEVARRFDMGELRESGPVKPSRGRADAGDEPGATSVLGNVSALLAREEWMRWRHSLRHESGMARMRLEQGDTVSASQHAARLGELAIRYKAGKYLALSLHISAEVALANGDPDSAEAAIGAALQALDRTPTPIVAYRLSLTAARVCAALHDPVGAQRSLDRSRVIIEAIAASVRDEALRAGFLGSLSLGGVRETAA